MLKMLEPVQVARLKPVAYLKNAVRYDFKGKDKWVSRGQLAALSRR